MKKESLLKILRDNPVFWSRLGFCYDPPIADEKGEPLVFQPDFTDQLRIHDDFSNAGVKIHTCILHAGWVGVDQYDYRLCDRVLEGIFKSGQAQYFIPRIKLNVPIGWCKENPSEVFVYENGPQSEEEIQALVGTLKQDYLGYESEVGYYNANGWQDPRPNLGGMISLQSFSSRKWLEDASEALKRLVNRLESSPYADRILGYHIAYGASGESMPWGRQSKRFGDYGISAKKNFLLWAEKKYGSSDALIKAWGADAVKAAVPPSHLREKPLCGSDDFYKDDKVDSWSIDYDAFMSEANTNALMAFSKVVKDQAPEKLVGAFYGYLLHMSRSAYAGHLGFERLLQCPHIDFFAAPKSYFRCGPGESGGEMSATVSINRKKLWVDECDNRTHLTIGDYVGNAENLAETCMVQLREFCKNISHNSGLWYMDLGGGWYDDKGIMRNISSIIQVSEKLRKKDHESRAEIIVIIDEKSVMHSHPLAVRPLENFLRNLQLCGAPIDIIFSFDIENSDFSYAKAAIFLTPLCISQERVDLVKSKLPEKGNVIFLSKMKYCGDFSLIASKNVQFPEFYIEDREGITPILENAAGKIICAKNERGEILISSLGLRVDEIRKILEHTPVRFYAPKECTVYADNRIISFFAREELSFVPNLPDGVEIKNILSGESFKIGEELQMKAKQGMAYIVE